MNAFPLFVGADRSGTTMVQAVFNAHPALVVTHESHFVVALLRRRRRYEHGGHFRMEPFLHDLLTFSFAARWGLEHADVRAAVGMAYPQDTAAAIRAVFQLTADRAGKPRYADKTPGYVEHIELIASAMPEARFVHVIRDGRDVALSVLEMEWGPRSLSEAAAFWRRRVSRGREAGIRLGPSRYAELRYEDFVTDPEASTRGICDFLALPFDAGMLDYERSAGAVLSQTIVPHRHQAVLRGPTPGLRDWRSTMDGRALTRFEAIAGPTLSQCAYERALSRIPPGARLRAQADRARARLLKRHREGSVWPRGGRLSRRAPTGPASSSAASPAAPRRGR